MGQIADVIVRGGRASVGYCSMLLEGITPDRFARLIRIDGHTVNANHPAFCFGHLALYPSRIAEMAGHGGKVPAAPAPWEDLFGAGKDCRDDPDGSIYPPMDEIVARFSEGYEALFALLGTLDDAALAGPNPREGRLKEMFPTLDGAVNFMCTCHVMVHAGQVSTWRRCMGLGPVM